MTARKAASEAWKLYRANFGQLLKLTLAETLLRVAVLAPCLALVAKEIRWVAALTLLLFVVLTLPVRRNTAEALHAMAKGEPFVTPDILLGNETGRKLGQTLATGLRLLIWALPLLAAIGYGYYLIVLAEDGFMSLRLLRSIGGGDTTRGVLNVALIFLACGLLVLLGCAFHSADRHALAVTGSKTMLKKRHGVILRTWLLGILTLVPFLAVSALAGAGYLKELIRGIQQLKTTGRLAIPKPDRNLYVILAAFLVLVIPLIPLKTLCTACWVYGEAEIKG